MCPLAGWASRGLRERPGRISPRPVSDGYFTYAMNMRAAEAIVSNAPKAMKIFPISEV